MDIHRARFVDYTPHTITSVAFSHKPCLDKPAPQNLRLAVGRSNGDIEIWNPRHGWIHELTLYGARGRSVEGLCWSNEGDSLRLFSIGGSTVVTEWDFNTQKPLANYDCNAGVIWSISVNSSGGQLAVGCDDGSVVIIDISGGKGQLEHHLICQRQDSRVLSVCWYKDEVIVGGCADGRLRSWSIAEGNRGRIVGTMRVDKSKTESTLVWSVKVLPRQKLIVSGDSTGSVKIWDINQYTLLQSFKVHDADVLSIVQDAAESKFFTAGVDRKIHQFQLIKPSSGGKSTKWTHSNSRLLHSNDVRTMDIYESKGCNFLVSGGVEKSIVISSTLQFHDGKYRKLPMTQQLPNITINGSNSLVAQWQDQSVSIWKIFQDKFTKPYQLVAKLSLANDENITSVSFNQDATLLAVSTFTSVKLFQLIYNDKKIQIQKIRDEEFDSLVGNGAKKVIFFDTNENKLLLLTPENEIQIFKVKVDLEDEGQKIKMEFLNDIELHTSSTSLTRHPFGNNINNVIISNDLKSICISRYNGSIELYPTNGEEVEVAQITKLSSYPLKMCYSNNQTIMVITEDNKLYELDPSKGQSLLTAWSKRNSEFLPKQFLTLDDKPQGIFTDSKSNRIWIYGSSWLSFFDLNEDIPVNKRYQNTANSNRKRDRDGLQIQDNLTSNDDTVNDFDGNIDILENNVEILELSLKQSRAARVQENSKNDSTTEDTKPFWMTSKYRPILAVDTFLDGIIVVELPSIVSTTPAFNLPKLKV